MVKCIELSLGFSLLFSVITTNKFKHLSQQTYLSQLNNINIRTGGHTSLIYNYTLVRSPAVSRRFLFMPLSPTHNVTCHINRTI